MELRVDDVSRPKATLTVLSDATVINNNVLLGEDLRRQGKPWLIEEETLDVGGISPTGTPRIRLMSESQRPSRTRAAIDFSGDSGAGSNRWIDFAG